MFLIEVEICFWFFEPFLHVHTYLFLSKNKASVSVSTFHNSCFIAFMYLFVLVFFFAIPKSVLSLACDPLQHFFVCLEVSFIGVLFSSATHKTSTLLLYTLACCNQQRWMTGWLALFVRISL